jgi:Anti-sigma factor NepR
MTDRKPGRPIQRLAQEEWPKVHSDASLGPDIQTKIGEQLRALYNDVVDQGVPDRFAELLRRLDQQGDKDRS